MPTKLLCSIVLAGGDQMDEVLESLDDLAKSVGNLGRDPMWMRDCSGEWFHLELLRRMIARTISKVSTNWTEDWPTDQTNQQIKPTIYWLRPTDQVIENDGLARPDDFGKTQNQLKNNWLNDYNHRQYRGWYRMRFGIGQRSGSGARSLKPARGQETTAEVLKIQEVQEVNVGR